MTRVISKQLGDKPLPIGKNQNGEHARNVGHSGVPPDDINLAWSAMVLLPNNDWATIRCYEGQIREHTLH